MPFFELQDYLGIDWDRWFLQHSSQQPYKIPSRCHVFEKEWLECSKGIGEVRSKKECRLEHEDFVECITLQKMMKRIKAIKEERAKLMKEGKYIPPDSHSGKKETEG